MKLEDKIKKLVEHDYQRMGVKEIVSHAREDITRYYEGWDSSLVEMRYEDLFGRRG